jgi:nucleoside-diphosphate-sugar epimerase
MHILILGAGGFIGAHLTERLIARGGDRVTALDVSDEKLDLDDASRSPGNSHAFTFVRKDIRFAGNALEEMVAASNCVVDLIAIANPSVYLSDPLDVFRLNFTENLKVVELCVKHRRRLVQFSTCEVYGKTTASVLGIDPLRKDCPFGEDTSPLIMGPVGAHRWIYACAKQLLERVIHAYGLAGKLDYTIVRPFNFIGPRIDYLPSERTGNPRVFSHFMNALLYGTPMRLVNGGNCYRAYTYITDAVDCIELILRNANGVCSRQIINIGSPGNETSIRELAETMCDIFDKEFRQPSDPWPPQIVSVSGEEFYGRGYEDCDRRIPDISKARKLLGWEPRYELRPLLTKTMAYFVERHRASQAVGMFATSPAAISTPSV